MNRRSNLSLGSLVIVGGFLGAFACTSERAPDGDDARGGASGAEEPEGGAGEGGAGPELGGTGGGGVVEVPCGRTIAGDVEIASAADLEELADVCVIEGDLVITNATVTVVDLPLLREVGGNLLVDANAALAELRLPVIERVATHYEWTCGGGNGFVLRDNVSLTLVVVPRLRDVDCSFIVESNASLETLRLPALERVQVEEPDNSDPHTANLLVLNNAVLSVLDLPVLREVKASLRVESNPALTVLSLPALERVGYFFWDPTWGTLTVSDNAALTTVHLPVLGDAWGADLSILANPALTQVVMPLAEPRSIEVISNASLTVLGFPAAGSLVSLNVEENPLLTDLDLSALSRIGGWEYSGWENEEDAVASRISHNAALAELALPALSFLGGELFVFENPVLSRVALPELAEGDDYIGPPQPALAIASNPLLVDLELPKLDDAQLRLTNNDSLVELSLPFASVGPAITGNALLASLTLPGLVSIEQATFSDNAALTALSLPNLTAVSDKLTVSDNPVLETLNAPALTSTAAQVIVSGCPELASCTGPVVEPLCGP